MTIDTRHKVWCNLGPLAAEPSSFADSFIQGSGGGVIMTKGTINLKGIYQYPPGYPVDIAYSDSQNWIARVPRRLRVMNTFANPLTNVTSVLVGCKFAYLENRKPPVKNPTEKELNEDDPEISDVERRARTVSVRARDVAAHILNALGLTPATAIPFTITKVVDEWDLSAGFVQELAKIAESECYRCFINMNEQVDFIDITGNAGGIGPVIEEDRLIDLTPQTVGELPADTVFARYESLALKEPQDDPNSTDPEDEKNRQKRNWELEESFSVEQYIHSYTGDDGKEYEQRGVYEAYSYTRSEYDSADRLKYRRAVKNDLLGESITETWPTYLIDEASASFLNSGGEYLIGPDKEDASAVTQEYNRSIAPIGNIASTCGFEGSIQQLKNMGTIFSDGDTSFSNQYLVSVREVFFDKNKDAGATKTVTRNYVPFMVTPFGSDEVAKMTQRLPPKIVNNAVSQAWFDGVQRLMYDAISMVEYGSEVRIRTEREFGTQSRPSQQERNKEEDKKYPSVLQESEIAWAVGSASSQTALELSPPYTSDDRIMGSNGNYSVARSNAAQQAAAYARTENRLLLAHRSGAGFQLLPIDTPPKPFDLFCVRLNGCTAAYRVNGTTWTINPTGFVCTVEGLFWGAIDGTVENAWFPLFPGATVLPAPVSVTTNASPAPANSIPMPTLFDPVNPNLTELFTSLPTTTPPVYVAQAQPAHIIPPYHETIELTAGVQVGAGFNIQAWIPTSLDLEAGVRVGASVQAYNPVLVPSKEISVAANAPSVRIGKAVAVPATVITVAPEVPTIDKFTTVNVPASVVQVAAIAPDKAGDASLIVTVPLTTIQVAAVAPDRAGEDATKVLVPAAVVDVAAIAPQVEIQAAGVSVPTAGAIVVAGLVPVINPSADPFFSANSLLIPFDGTVGSNAAPLDRSNNALTLTVGGSAPGFTISDTQFKYGQAGHFNGSARIEVPATSLLSFPGDFELQMWFYMLSRGGYSTMLELGAYSNGIMIRPGTADPGVWINGGQIGGSGTTLNALSLNAWHHIALSRIGTAFKVYINGTQAHEVQVSGTVNGGTGQTFIGDSTHAPGRFFEGYIDDLRIKKGVSTITGNFTPTGPHPTQGLPDPYFASTSLLLPLDGANNSTTFTDFSSNNLAMTRHGNAVITTTNPKYGTGSLLLQTTGDYISTPASSAFAFGTGDFTVECHCLFTSATNNGLFAFANGLALSVFSGQWWLSDYGSGGTPMGAHMAANTWVFVRVTRSGTQLKLFIDGVQIGSTLTNATNLTQNECWIGMYFSPAYTWLGKIDNFRITKGVARTDAPPVGPHPIQGPSTIVDVPSTAVSVQGWTPKINPDPLFASTSLLLPLDSSFADFSGNNFTPSIIGTGVSISTTTIKYGAGAAYFNNAGYVSYGQQNALLFDGDFTIECWVRLDALNQDHTIGSSSNASNTQIFRYGFGGNNLVTCYINDQFVVNAANAGTQAQVWQHLALCRSGSNTRFFADGVQVGATYTSNFGTFRMDVIGATLWTGGVTQYLKGHIDDLRLTKAARYTANFTPPTGPHPLS